MNMFGYIVAAAVVVVALPAQAGSGSGLVRNIIAHVSGVVMFKVDAHPNAPACSPDNSFAFDGSTPEGKNKYALILAAANAKKSVTVIGTGNCAVWGDRENVLYIAVDF